MFTRFLIFTLTIFNACIVTAQIKPYDTSLNHVGYVVIPIDTTDDQCMDMTTLTDGRIILCGYTKQGDYYQGALTRILPNGITDSSFGINGKTIAITSTKETHFNRVCATVDGKIIVSGEHTILNTDYREIIAMRFDSTGKIDSSFGTNGITALGGPLYRSAGLALQTDGKILIVGDGVTGYSGDDGIIIRLNTDGSFDRSFNGSGFRYILPSQTPSAVGLVFSNVKQLSDGKIIVSGFADVYNTNANIIIRLNAYGSFDNTFKSTGFNLYQYDGGMQTMQGVDVLASGKINVLSYEATLPATYLLGQLNSNGSLQTSFGTRGRVRLQRQQDVFAWRFAYHPWGNYYTAGYSRQTDGNSAAVCIIDTNGHTDSAWAADGMFEDRIGNGATSSSAVTTLAQPDGMILVAGSTMINGKNQFYVARLVPPKPELGIQHIGTETTLVSSFYPNPTKGNINIQLYTKGRVAVQASIMSVDGKMIYRQIVENHDGSETLVVKLPSNLVAGTYFLKLAVGDRSVTKRFQYLK